jgi:RNA polymerase sigma-B factor
VRGPLHTGVLRLFVAPQQVRACPHPTAEAGYLTCSSRYSERLSTPTGGDGSFELGDAFADPDDALEAITDRLTITGLIHLLPDRIQRMLVMRFYGNLTQAQIAAAFGISQMHVSRLLTQALSWLRAAMLSDVPPPWGGGADRRGPDGMRVRVGRIQGTVTGQVCGEVDRDTADRLRISLHSAVAAAAAGGVVIDL